MRFVRSLSVGAMVAAAAAGMSLAGAGSASALGISPLPEGVQVDLNHDETVWAQHQNIGGIVAGIPGTTTESFGATFAAATLMASQYPEGRVTFTAQGPVSSPKGLMVVFKE